jgi:hypothetical protein
MIRSFSIYILERAALQKKHIHSSNMWNRTNTERYSCNTKVLRAYKDFLNLRAVLVRKKSQLFFDTHLLQIRLNFVDFRWLKQHLHWRKQRGRWYKWGLSKNSFSLNNYTSKSFLFDNLDSFFSSRSYQFRYTYRK